MERWKEKVSPHSCWNKARTDEPVFILLGRDVAAPAAIRAWVNVRHAKQKNAVGDTQTTEALMMANQMERYQQDGLNPRDLDSSCEAPEEYPARMELALPEIIHRFSNVLALDAAEYASYRTSLLDAIVSALRILERKEDPAICWLRALIETQGCPTSIRAEFTVQKTVSGSWSR